MNHRVKSFYVGWLRDPLACDNPFSPYKLLGLILPQANLKTQLDQTHGQHYELVVGGELGSAMPTIFFEGHMY